MGDDLNGTYIWICPKCGQRYEETDIGQLDARVQTHKCETPTNKDKYLEALLDDKRLIAIGGKK